MRDTAIGVWFAKWTEIPIHTSPRVMPHPKWVFGSDHGLSADATGAPAILLEDSRPQAILKLRPPNSLDYSTRYGCQPVLVSYKSLCFPTLQIITVTVQLSVVLHF